MPRLALYALLPALALAQPAAIDLSSPRDFQVFQRDSKSSGILTVAGRALIRCDRAEARIAGADWQPIPLDSAAAFHADLRLPAGGWYRFELRLLLAGQPVAALEVPHTGIGEIFIVAGQSNATNYGEVRQQARTSMVAAWSPDGAWRLADDPQPAVQDHSTKGSFIPAFGDALFEALRVPIGIAAVGHGSTSVRQWLPKGGRFSIPPTMTKFVTQIGPNEWQSDGTLFDGMRAAIRSFGPHGFRALLWHQGESDAHQKPANEISAAVYARLLEQVIRASRKEAGWDFPWFVAQASYHSPADPSSPELRAAQQSLWQTGLALQGPDTDRLTGDNRQNNGTGVHFSAKGLNAHGRLWADTILAWLR